LFEYIPSYTRNVNINYLGHSPGVNSVMPEQLATQALPYVLLLHPQTGSYCWVHTQSLSTFSTQAVESSLQHDATTKSMKATLLIFKNLIICDILYIFGTILKTEIFSKKLVLK
jgi:hypothetical protein